MGFVLTTNPRVIQASTQPWTTLGPNSDSTRIPPTHHNVWLSCSTKHMFITYSFIVVRIWNIIFHEHTIFLSTSRQNLSESQVTRVEVYWVIIALRFKHGVFFLCAVSIVAGNVWDGVSKLKAKVVSSSGSKSTGLDQGTRTVAAGSLG